MIIKYFNYNNVILDFIQFFSITGASYFIIQQNVPVYIVGCLATSMGSISGINVSRDLLSHLKKFFLEIGCTQMYLWMYYGPDS